MSENRKQQREQLIARKKAAMDESALIDSFVNVKTVSQDIINLT